MVWSLVWHILKKMKKLFKLLKLLVTIVLLWIVYFLLYGNFHKVDENLYRSAQLFSFNLPHYIQKYKIHSIINLRGGEGKEFYNDEIRISKEHNVTHYNYSISDRKIQSIATMEEIVNLLKQAPKPILIHCKAGADRTSLVSALYLYAIKHDPNASDAISLLYGHFPWFGSPTVAMDISFQNYVKKYPLSK